MEDYSTFTDLQLIDLLKNDDDSAFKTLYQRYWKRLLYFANQKTADLAEAENVVQDIFVSLWNRRSDLNISISLENYLIVSVKYRVIKLFNKQRTQRISEEKSLVSYDILDDSTQQYLDFEELQHRLQELIGKLPEKGALIYRMNKEQGMNHKQIAQELGISEKAVNSHLVRSKKALRSGLDSSLNSFLL